MMLKVKHTLHTYRVRLREVIVDFRDFVSMMKLSSSMSYKVVRRGYTIAVMAMITMIMIVIVFQTVSEISRMNRKTDYVIGRVSHELSLPFWNMDSIMVDSILKILVDDDDIDVDYIALYDARNRLYRGVYSDMFDKLIPFYTEPSKNFTPGLMHRKVSVTIELYGQKLGYAEVYLTWWRVVKRIALNTTLMISIFMVIIFLMFFAINRSIQKLFIKPLLDLSAIVEEYSQKDFTKRAPVRSNDELGALALHFNEMADQIQKYSRNLERMVEERTSQLIESEKMAALGELVAGISHEINTPIGTAITAASYIEKKSQSIKTLFENEKMTRVDFSDYITNTTDAMSLTLANLDRASELVQSFKKVAVDRSSMDRRKFNMKEYLGDIVTSLKPRYKRTGHHIEIEADESLVVDSFPGDISQVITNLIMNSLIHAYPDPDKKGIMRLRSVIEHGRVLIVFSDDGVGIPEEYLSKIFLPFFTTKRGSGGSGLGLNIAYNIVTQKLGGTIECKSSREIGTTFVISFPIEDEPDRV